MKVSDMSEKQKNQFWSLFLGDKWAENIHVSQFDKVWKFMEKEYPDLLEKYLSTTYSGLAVYPNTKRLRNWTNLDNLLTFLIENEDT